MSTQGKSDANEASLMGHLFPSKRRENMEIRISFCTKKYKGLKIIVAAKAVQFLCSQAHVLHVRVNTIFLEGIFLCDSLSVLLKYLLMDCIKTSFGL